MRLQSFGVVLAFALVACGDRAAPEDQTKIGATGAVQGQTPDAAFMNTCLRSYQGVQLVSSGASVRRTIESFKLAPTATTRWERVNDDSYILRMENNDPLTGGNVKIGFQFDRQKGAANIARCDQTEGVTDLSRIVVNGTELPSQNHFDAMVSMLDFERLAQESANEQNAVEVPPSQTAGAVAPAVGECAGGDQAILQCIRNKLNDTNSTAGDVAAGIISDNKPNKLSELKAINDELAELNQFCEGEYSEQISIENCKLNRAIERLEKLQTLSNPYG